MDSLIAKISLLSFILPASQLLAANGDLGGGLGTEISPYLIEDRADFDEYASDGNYWASGKYCRLEIDLVLSQILDYVNSSFIAPQVASISSIPMERNVDFGPTFQGVLDGNEHTIAYTIFSQPDGNGGYFPIHDYTGLIGYMEGTAVVRNLNVAILIRGGNNDYAGGISAVNEGGVIENCHADGGVNVNSAGGICGWNTGTIRDCTSNVGLNIAVDSGVTFANRMGGLCGYNSGHISNCFVTGNTGGGIGYLFYVGGFCGVNASGGVIEDSAASGDVGNHGNNYAANLGGFCGDNEGLIRRCRYDGPVVSAGFGRNEDNTGMIGGFCGDNGGEIFQCHVTQTRVEGGKSSVGGFVGYNTGIINQCFTEANVFHQSDGGAFIGGFVGLSVASNARIDNCYATGIIQIALTKSFIGGFSGGSGNEHESNYNNCYSTSRILHGNFDSKWVGGFIPYRFLGSSSLVQSSFWSGDELDQLTPHIKEWMPHSASMQDIQLYSDAGWDFIWETANGLDDIWIMAEYPKLAWHYLPENYTVAFDLGLYGQLNGGDLTQTIAPETPLVLPSFDVDERKEFLGWHATYNADPELLTLKANYGFIDGDGIDKVEYFVDVDPGIEQGTEVTLIDAPLTKLETEITPDLTSLAPAGHHLYLRARNERGQWGMPTKFDFYTMPQLLPSAIRWQILDGGDVILEGVKAIAPASAEHIESITTDPLPNLASGDYQASASLLFEDVFAGPIHAISFRIVDISIDTDGDGLPDYVETNTGIYVSDQDTGTNPLSKDSDGDLLEDNDEIGINLDPNVSHEALVNFFTQRTKDLAFGTPVIVKDADGNFHLSIELSTTDTLDTWNKEFLQSDNVTIENGEIVVKVLRDGDVLFYRLSAK